MYGTAILLVWDADDVGESSLMTHEEEMVLLLFCMKRGYEQMRRDSDSPIQQMIDKANKLLEGFNEDELTERAFIENSPLY